MKQTYAGNRGHEMVTEFDRFRVMESLEDDQGLSDTGKVFVRYEVKCDLVMVLRYYSDGRLELAEAKCTIDPFIAHDLYNTVNGLNPKMLSHKYDIDIDAVREMLMKLKFADDNEANKAFFAINDRVSDAQDSGILDSFAVESVEVGNALATALESLREGHVDVCLTVKADYRGSSNNVGVGTAILKGDELHDTDDVEHYLRVGESYFELDWDVLPFIRRLAPAIVVADPVFRYMCLDAFEMDSDDIIMSFFLSDLESSGEGDRSREIAQECIDGEELDVTVQDMVDEVDEYRDVLWDYVFNNSNYSEWAMEIHWSDIKSNYCVNESAACESAGDGYSKWKSANVTYRGVRGDEPGSNGNGSGFLGKGLYTTPASNKAMARTYGNLYLVVNGRPKNPKVFGDTNQWEIWLYNNLVTPLSAAKGREFPDIRDFNASTTIEAEMLKLGYDGVEIKGREMVNYTPTDVRYFRTEGELRSYYDSVISS